jgi:hypothetical protein
MTTDENEALNDDGLTPEQLSADDAAVAADLEPLNANLVAEKRKKAGGHRRKADKRFSTHVLGDAPNATTNNSDDPWDSTASVFEEVVRVASIVHLYCHQPSGAFTEVLRPDANKDEMIQRVFDGRGQTTANLMKLYAFM